MSSVPSREASVLMQTYRRHQVTFVRGEGVWLYDDLGREYLDCLSGLAVVSVGHSNSRVADAAHAQLTALTHTSNLYFTEPQVALGERLAALSGLDRVFFANCGATANEAAIKLARRWGRRRRGATGFEILSLLGSFHGRTLATLAATGQPAKQIPFEPLPPGFRQVEAGDLDILANAAGPHTVAVLLETIQGEGGVIPLDAAYLRGVRALCDRLGMLMIVDDVQAGLGRTGEWFSWQGLGFCPDVATSAKALGNGLPIGACLAREEVAAAFEYGDHATTFGGGPVVCRAALAVLDEIEQRHLLENVRARSGQLAARLSELPGVKEVRGRGLLLAAVLDAERAVEVTERALTHGLVVNAVCPDAVRFTPPLVITEQQVSEAVDRFARALS